MALLVVEAVGVWISTTVKFWPAAGVVKLVFKFKDNPVKAPAPWVADAP